MENTEQGDTHNLRNSNLPQTFNVLPPFPLTWFEPRLRIQKRTFDVALVNSVLFSSCCAWFRKRLLLISRSTRKEIASRIPCLLQDSRNKLTRRTRWEREWKKSRLWLASLTDITTCLFLPTTLVNLISILCDSLWARRSEVPRDLH